MTTLRFFTGAHSHEFQIGKLVIQVRRSTPAWVPADLRNRPVHVFTDPFGRWI